MASPSFSTALAAFDATVLDTETTGLDARSARLIQIGAVRISKGSVQAGRSFESLVNPGCPIPPRSTAIHGIGDSDVAGAPPFADVADALQTFLAGTIVIGHTISFDLAILERENRLAGRLWRAPRALDVRMLARLAAPSLAQYDLDGLCDWLGITIRGRHTALGDAEATAEAFIRLVPLLRERNIRTLAEAEAASRALAEKEARSTGGLPLEPALAGDEPAALVRVDSFAYSRRVQDVMTAPPLFVNSGIALHELSRILLERKASSAFVGLPGGETGIVTERDVLRAMAEFGGEALGMAVASFARAPLLTVSEAAFIYRAIGRMERLGIRHLGVRGTDGDIVGVVTPRDLLRHRASTAIMLGDEIDTAENAAALAAAWSRLPLMVRSLISDQLDPRTISAVVSAEIHALTRRAAELAEAAMAKDGLGTPPTPYCVLVLGSAGRGESLLAADQDNAIVYEAGESEGEQDRFFAELGRRMCRTLDETGVPYCKGGVMAQNRAWRMSVADWRATVDGWVRRQSPGDLLNVDIFFDAVAVHGDLALGDAVWRFAHERGQAAKDFQKLLAEAARQRDNPFTLLGGLRVDGEGRLDLKKTGLLPLFTGARVLSIRHGVLERSTPARLSRIAALGEGAESDILSLIEAHRDILGFALGQQLIDTEAGIPLSNRIEVRRLARRERQQLSTALGKVAVMLDLVSEGRM
jgi:DNA polymerase-3 subunit epsilon/CBS domain-containing protein